MILSSCRLNFCQCLLQDHKKTFRSFPLWWTFQDSSIPLLLQHIQISMCRPCDIGISVQQGMILPSEHGVELELHCDDERWSHLESTRSQPGLQRHSLILSVETLLVHLEFPCWDLHSLRSIPNLEWVLGIRSLSLTILLHKLLLGKWIHHLCVINISVALILRG